MISCYQLNVPHPRAEAPLFDGASFEVEAGQWAEIQGTSGSGKTLLFSLLSLRSRTQNVKLIVAGRNASRLGSDGLAEIRKRIGSCPEEPHYLEHRSLIENLLLPFVARGEHKGAYEQVTETLVRVGMDELANVEMKNLSLTERSAAGVLRALVGRPDVVLLDEILGRTGIYRGPLEKELARVRDEGTTVVVFALTDPASRHADVVFGLRDGVITVDQGTAARPKAT
ncbi:MAG: ATP-binding cassette domain-containing protein [Myxococcota bacterium]